LARLLALEIHQARPGRLAFQPCFGIGHIDQRPCQMARVSALWTGRDCARFAHHLEGSVPVRERTTEEQ